jgi:hypothetical protein
LLDHTDLSAAEIARIAMEITASLCIFTNDHISVETLNAGSMPQDPGCQPGSEAAPAGAS